MDTGEQIKMQQMIIEQLQAYIKVQDERMAEKDVLWSSIFVTLLTVKIMFFYFCSYRASKGVL